jgi:hypothetical protein
LTKDNQSCRRLKLVISFFNLKLKAMKKILLTTAVITLFFTSVKAGTIGHNADKETRRQLRKEKREERREMWLHSVNRATENQFYSDFPNAKDVSWTEGAFAEATFQDGDVFKTAFYDMDNELVGTTTNVDYSALPDRAKLYIEKKYPGYTIDKVILFDDNEANDTDMYLFNSRFEDEDTYFPLLSNGSKQLLLKVTTEGNVSFFQDYK